MQKMTGTQAILMPAHETKAHGVDAWAVDRWPWVGKMPTA